MSGWLFGVLMLLELSVALCAPPQNHVALFERLLHLGFKPVLAKGSEQVMNLEVVEIFVFWSRIDTLSHRTKFVPESVRLAPVAMIRSRLRYTNDALRQGRNGTTGNFRSRNFGSRLATSWARNIPLLTISSNSADELTMEPPGAATRSTTRPSRNSLSEISIILPGSAQSPECSKRDSTLRSAKLECLLRNEFGIEIHSGRKISFTSRTTFQ